MLNAVIPRSEDSLFDLNVRKKKERFLASLGMTEC
jgi:hypothetical protein